MDKPKSCAGKVWERFEFRRCTMPGKLEHEGKTWCKRHHPPNVEEKQKRSHEQDRKKYADELETRVANLNAQAEIHRKARAYDALVGSVLTTQELLEFLAHVN